MQSERDKFIDTLGQRIENLTSTVDNLWSKLAQVESSLIVTKAVNNYYENALLHLIGVFMTKNRLVKESLEVAGIPSSVDDKRLQSTVCSILGVIDVVCDSNDIEDCHSIKGDRP